MICNTCKNRTFLNVRLCAATSVGISYFATCRKCDRKRITSIANGATRCNAPSPFVVAISIIAHLNAPKQKIRKIQYYRIGVFRVPIRNMKSIYLRRHEFYIVLLALCASKNSLSQITAVKCTVYRIPITQHAAREFLSPSMQNFTFHHWNSYRAF